jgi:hypothetical protein
MSTSFSQCWPHSGEEGGEAGGQENRGSAGQTPPAAEIRSEQTWTENTKCVFSHSNEFCSVFDQEIMCSMLGMV